jgi:hypothetical protein
MALNTPGMITDLTNLLQYPGDTEAECAETWADLLRAYTDLIVPAVAGPVQDAAKAAFETALAGMAIPNAALAVFDAAFAAYAGALAVGMVPAGVPPPALLSLTLAPVFPLNNLPGVTHAMAATAIGTVLDAWFRTGTSGGGAPWS